MYYVCIHTFKRCHVRFLCIYVVHVKNHPLRSTIITVILCHVLHVTNNTNNNAAKHGLVHSHAPCLVHVHKHCHTRAAQLLCRCSTHVAWTAGSVAEKRERGRSDGSSFLVSVARTRGALQGVVDWRWLVGGGWLGVGGVRGAHRQQLAAQSAQCVVNCSDCHFHGSSRTACAGWVHVIAVDQLSVDDWSIVPNRDGELQPYGDPVRCTRPLLSSTSATTRL